MVVRKKISQWKIWENMNKILYYQGPETKE